MAISPIPQGQTHVKLSLTWKDDSNAVVDLTGATVTCRISAVPGGTGAAGAGTVTVTGAAAGTLTYAFDATDVATSGDYEIQFKAVYGDGTILYSDPLYYVVTATV